MKATLRMAMLPYVMCIVFYFSLFTQFYFDHESFMLQTIAMLILVTVIIVRLPGRDIEFSI